MPLNRVHSRVRTWRCYANFTFSFLPHGESPAQMPPEPPRLDDSWEELERLYMQGLELLEGIDRLGLYPAGAHLAMALEAMRQHHPALPPFD